MTHILKLCPKCSKNPATIQCIDCEEKMCYSCESKVHKNSRNHKTDIIPYEQMKQIKSTKFIISNMKEQSPNFDQQQELNELQGQIDSKTTFLQQQQDKWTYQINTLEESYQNKLKEFEKKIENTEQSFQQYNSNSNGQAMIEDIKKQMEVSKKKAWTELNDLKQKLSEKEQLLKEMIQKEQSCAQEIGKKDQLIKTYKDFIQKQQKERDLIKSENAKIRAQLESIKTLFKSKLPQLGIQADFLEKIGGKRQEDIDEEAEDNENDDEEQEEVEEEENQNDENNEKQDVNEDEKEQIKKEQ